MRVGCGGRGLEGDGRLCSLMGRGVCGSGGGGGGARGFMRGLWGCTELGGGCGGRDEWEEGFVMVFF